MESEQRGRASQQCDARRRGTVADRPRDDARDSVVDEPFAERPLRVEPRRIEMRRQRLSAIAGERVGQRRDQAVEARLEHEPLVEAVLADGQARVDRRHMRRRRRGELAGQAVDGAVRGGAGEQRMVPMTLGDLEAEGVEVDQHHALEALAQRAEHRRGQGWAHAFAGEQPRDRAGQRRKAGAAMVGPHPAAFLDPVGGRHARSIRAPRMPDGD